MHLERSLLAVSKEKAVGRKVYLRHYGMLAQQIQEVRKQLHGSKIASFSGSYAVRDEVFDVCG